MSVHRAHPLREALRRNAYCLIAATSCVCALAAIWGVAR